MIQNHKKIKKTKTQETDSNSLEEEYTNKLSKKLKKCDKNREEPKITIITDTKLKFSLRKNTTNNSSQQSDNDDMDLIADDSSTTTKSEIFYDDQDKNITYRIGDWVYCEFEPDQPYVIRKIEDFSVRPDGSLEAKLRCAYRRSDISTSLLGLLEKKYSQYFTSIQSTLSFPLSSTKTDDTDSASTSSNLLSVDSADLNMSLTQNLTPKQMYQLRHHELFYSKFIESNVPVKLFRGKVNLNLFLSEIETFNDYLNPSIRDNFFYQITYDPNLKLLSADRGQIRTGSKFQADIPDLVLAKSRSKKSKLQADKTTDHETLLWDGEECGNFLGKQALNKYFNQIIDKKLKSNEHKHNDCEVNESRDKIMYDSMIHLHKCKYDKWRAQQTFSYNNIQSDDHKVWNETEMNKFEEGIEKLGKDFYQIKIQFLPGKTLQSIIEYYYNIWKISDDYIEKRNLKRENKKKRLIEITVPQSAELININRNLVLFEEHEIDAADETNEFKARKCISCLKQKTLNYFNRNTTHNLIENNRIKNAISITSTNATNTSLLDLNKETTLKYQIQQQNDNNLKLIFLKQNVIEAEHKSDPQTQPLQLQQQANSQQVIVENLCNHCWVYWKKYGAFKNNFESTSLSGVNAERPCPEKRLERINAIRSQLYTCLEDKCGKEFKEKKDFAMHSQIAHSLILKAIIPRPTYKQIHNFTLNTTPLTRAARFVFENSLPARKNYFKKLARQSTLTKTADFALIKKTWYDSHKDIRETLNELTQVEKKANKKTKTKNLEKVIKKIKTNKKKEVKLNKKLDSSKSSTASSSTSLYPALMQPRPMTPLSPTIHECSYNDTSHSSSSSYGAKQYDYNNTSNKLDNSKSFLSIDCNFNQSQANSRKTSQKTYKMPTDCLSPSPSPTPSPSSNSSNSNHANSNAVSGLLAANTPKANEENDIIIEKLFQSISKFKEEIYKMYNRNGVDEEKQRDSLNKILSSDKLQKEIKEKQKKKLKSLKTKNKHKNIKYSKKEKKAEKVATANGSNLDRPKRKYTKKSKEKQHIDPKQPKTKYKTKKSKRLELNKQKASLNSSLDDSVCMEDWYFKSNKKLKTNRFDIINKEKLKKLSRAPNKYTYESENLEFNKQLVDFYNDKFNSKTENSDFKVTNESETTTERVKRKYVKRIKLNSNDLKKKKKHKINKKGKHIIKNKLVDIKNMMECQT